MVVELDLVQDRFALMHDADEEGGGLLGIELEHPLAQFGDGGAA